MMIQLKEVYGKVEPAPTTLYKWLKVFKGGRTNIADGERSGRPQEIGDDKVEKLKEIVVSERKATKQELASRLNVSYGTVHTMLQSMGIRKLCSRFVPYFTDC